MKKPMLIFLDKLVSRYDSNALALARIAKEAPMIKNLEPSFLEKKMINTIWLGSDILTYQYDQGSGYNTLAHELGHILLNEGHIDSAWPKESHNPFEEKEDDASSSPIPFPISQNGHGKNHRRYAVYNLMISGMNEQYRTDYLSSGQCQKIQQNSEMVRPTNATSR